MPVARDQRAGTRRLFLCRGAALAGLGLLAAVGLVALPWQRPTRVPRIGYLGVGPSGPYPALLGAFREGLRELGYVEGESIAIEYRLTDEGLEQAPALANELVRLDVDVIVVTGAEAAQVAKDATATIPIVGTILGPVPVSTA